MAHSKEKLRHFLVRLADTSVLMAVAPDELQARGQLIEMFGPQDFFTIDDIPEGKTLIMPIDLTGTQLGPKYGFGLKKLD